MSEELALKQNALTISSGGQIEKLAMKAEDVIAQVDLIKKIMHEVMQEDVHYGKIPGTDKKTLLQPGAEKLNLTFRLDPEIEVLTETEQPNFIAYKVKCTLYHIPTGNRIASGVGACNSRESKYRWKNDKSSTGKPVPKEYWDLNNSGKYKEAKALIGGKDYGVIKEDGKWFIASLVKVEHDNPWDFQNTILKMAVKRAKVAAALNATAAGDIFTQDVEDMPEEMLNEENHRQESGKKPGNSKHQGQQQKPQQEQEQEKAGQQASKGKQDACNGNGLTPKAIWTKFSNLKYPAEYKDLYKFYYLDKFKDKGISTMNELSQEDLRFLNRTLDQALNDKDYRETIRKHLDGFKPKQSQSTIHDKGITLESLYSMLAMIPDFPQDSTGKWESWICNRYNLAAPWELSTEEMIEQKDFIERAINSKQDAEAFMKLLENYQEMEKQYPEHSFEQTATVN